MEGCIADVEKAMMLASSACKTSAIAPRNAGIGDGAAGFKAGKGKMHAITSRSAEASTHYDGGGRGPLGLQFAMSALSGPATQRKEQLAWKRWQAAAQDCVRMAWREWANYAIAFADLLQFPRNASSVVTATSDETEFALAAAGALDGAAALARIRDMLKPLSNDFQATCTTLFMFSE
jgi:hypothetical protein